MMRIGELSSKTGVPRSTLRFYEKKGLLNQSHRDTNGYRQYDGDAIERLHLIQVAQALGFTLTDIVALVSRPHGLDHQYILTELDRKQQAIAQQQRLLQTQANRLQRLKTALQESWQQGECADSHRLKQVLLEEDGTKNTKNADSDCLG